MSALILLTTWGGNQYAWDSGMIVGLGIGGVVLLALFVWQERRAAEPLMPGELFHSPVFNVASAMGFTVGMAMFGAIIYIPFFLQIVFGATPTESGLRMLPLMAGLLVASIASGRAISKMGRYRVFPITGTAVLVVGMFLLSRLGVGTPHWLASVYMAVVGVGIGLVMQVLVLVVQNDADPKDIGAATSTATFFRSLGGSFGVAIFGAIYASRLKTELGVAPARGGGGARQGAEPRAGDASSRRCSGSTSRRRSRTRSTASSSGGCSSRSSRSRCPGSSRRCRCGRRCTAATSAPRRPPPGCGQRGAGGEPLV